MHCCIVFKKKTEIYGGYDFRSYSYNMGQITTNLMLINKGERELFAAELARNVITVFKLKDKY